MNQFHGCETLNDMKSKIHQHAKREWLYLWEMWVEDYWLCYVLREKVNTDEHANKKKDFFEQKYGRKLEHTGTTTNYSSKRKDHKGKINLCNHVDPWKKCKKEIRKKIHYETGVRPNW